MRDPRRLARRWATLGQNTDAPAMGSVPELALDDGGAGKAALAPAALADAPGETGLDGRGGLVDVMAIEAQTRLQPQGIPRTKSDWLDLRHGQQPPRQTL